jgi:uncharacterized damage-inducible protein DinB
MQKTYRKGGVGALMDEYERAAAELIALIESLPAADFERTLDRATQDEDCRSVQTIMRHVVRAGNGYANYLRDAFGLPTRPADVGVLRQSEVPEAMRSMLAYTADTLDGRWEMTDEEVVGTVVTTRWCVVYDMEQLLEHAIVHILRHRRQVERLLTEEARAAPVAAG